MWWILIMKSRLHSDLGSPSFSFMHARIRYTCYHAQHNFILILTTITSYLWIFFLWWPSGSFFFIVPWWQERLILVALIIALLVEKDYIKWQTWRSWESMNFSGQTKQLKYRKKWLNGSGIPNIHSACLMGNVLASQECCLYSFVRSVLL